MSTQHHLSRKQPKRPLGSLLTIVAAAVCIVLGLIGIILPVLPGVIFFALAAVLLARVSSTMDAMVKRNAFMTATQDRVDSMVRLSWMDRSKLVFWYAGMGVVKVINFTTNFTLTMFRKASKKAAV